MFLILMVIGLVGLAMMAIPAFARHATAAPQVHHLPGHGAVAPRAQLAPSEPSMSSEMVPAAHVDPSGIVRWLPTPRGVFSSLALYGAFGNALLDALHLNPLLAGLAALAPTFVVERFVVRPLWNLVFRFQGQASASLDQLLLTEAVAVVPFRNGRGMVSTTREGRCVQLSARLCDEHCMLSVKVGDRLRIEEVDARRERVTVSVLPRELGV
jgi:hypothetical protein